MSVAEPPTLAVLPMPTCPYVFSPQQDKTGTLELAVVQSTQVVDAVIPVTIDTEEKYAVLQLVIDVAANELEYRPAPQAIQLAAAVTPVPVP
jgi:hypothetical protein